MHLYWMSRQGWDYGQMQKLGSHVQGLRHRDRVQQITDVIIGIPLPKTGSPNK